MLLNSEDTRHSIRCQLGQLSDIKKIFNLKKLINNLFNVDTIIGKYKCEIIYIYKIKY